MSILRLLRKLWTWLLEAGRVHEPERRGLTLMREWLSPAQREQYDTRGHFDVVGSHTGRRYRIRHGTAANVYELDEFDHPLTGWCFMPRDGLPAGDVMLAQKIALESDEQSALAVAKTFQPRWKI
jgi:hypothetical protein